MANNYWFSQFPYLVPVWHSVGQKSLSDFYENYVDPNLDLELGGIGAFEGTVLKQYQRLPYRIARPTLPFFADSSRAYGRYSGINCLAYSANKNVLFSSKLNRIYKFDLEINEHRFASPSNLDTNHPHLYNTDRNAEVNPFCIDTSRLTYYDEPDGQTIFIDLKIHETNSQLELMAQSRKSLFIFSYNNDSTVTTLFNVDFSNQQYSSLDLKLDYWDRNSNLPEKFLLTYLENYGIHLWNVETRQSQVETTIQLDMDDHKTKLIGVHWLNNLNPFLYLYGSHKELYMGDTRQRMSGDKSDNLLLASTNRLLNFRNFELFHTFIPSITDSHQIITTSDYNINFFDVRFPNKNCKHMCTGNLVNKITAARLRPTEDCNEKLLVMASNSHQLRLYTFDTNVSSQPRSEHVPFHLNLPSESDVWYPHLECSDHFFRGMQILPVQTNCPERHIFSVVTLLNNGDVYMQDFWPTSEDEQASGQYRANSEDQLDFIYENNYGDKVLFNSELDSATMQYIATIKSFIDEMNLKKDEIPNMLRIKFKRFLKQNCPQCFGEAGLNLAKRPNQLIGLVRPCSKNSYNFCTCLNDDLTEELQLLQLDSDQEEETIDSSNAPQLNEPIKWLDKDKLDMSFVKDNWHCFHNASNSDNPKGVRDFCRPLTVRVFERWLQDSTQVSGKGESIK